MERDVGELALREYEEEVPEHPTLAPTVNLAPTATLAPTLTLPPDSDCETLTLNLTRALTLILTLAPPRTLTLALPL